MSPKKRQKARTAPATTIAPKPRTRSQTSPITDHRPPTPPHSDRFVVDTIFPRHQLHIIGGPAHAGKSTLVFLIMSDFMAGHNIFGKQSYPAPFCYVSCVHPLAACRDIEARFECSVPMISAIDHGGCKNFDEVYEAADHKVPGVRVIFLDGILRIAGNSGMDNAVVGDFLSNLARKLQEYRVTVIATGRCSKPKESRSPVRTIDRFLGATAWTELSSTFIGIEPKQPNKTNDDRRTVTVMPKGASPFQLHYRFGPTGKLVEVAEVSGADSAERIEIIETLLGVRDPGEKLSTTELLEMGRDLGVLARSTMMAYISILMKQGKLLDGGYGWYVIPHTQ